MHWKPFLMQLCAFIVLYRQMSKFHLVELSSFASVLDINSRAFSKNNVWHAYANAYMRFNAKRLSSALSMRIHNEAQQEHICWWWEMKEIKNKTYEWWWWRRWIRRHFAHRKSIELIAERIKIFWSCIERMQRWEFGFGLRDTEGDRNKTRIYRIYVVKTFKKIVLEHKYE